MTYPEIFCWLQCTVKKLFGICFTQKQKNDMTIFAPLESEDLLYLYYEIWLKHHILISIDEIKNNAFYTPHQLAQTIVNHKPLK